jgi:hypothetical protein
MTKEEAKQWLINSPYRCSHSEQAEVVYRRRLYPLCKTCFLSTMRAISIINDKESLYGIRKEQDNPSATFIYAYTVHTTHKGHRPEIFNVWNQTTRWMGGQFDTKQRACQAAYQYLAMLSRDTNRCFTRDA